MISLHPKYIKDANGNNSMVILPVEEFERLLEELEDDDDVRMYDQAKKEDTGERILFSDYLKMRKERNG